MKQLKGEPTARLLRASKMGLKMTDMFYDGPAKLTVSDAWNRTSRVKILKMTITMNQMMNSMSCTDLNVQDKKYSPW